MALVPAKCPECGGNVVVDNEKEAWVCDFCKLPFVVDTAIQTFNTVYNTTNVTNVTNQNEIKADVVNVYDNLAKDFVIKAGELIEYKGESMDVVIPDNVVSIKPWVFHNTLIHSVVIPLGVQYIGDYAFRDCIKLESVQLPEGIESIGDGAFSGCVSLKSLTIPDSVQSLGKEAISCCNELESIVLPSDITRIPERLLKGCDRIRSIILPEKTTEIGDGAFAYCTSLAYIKIPEGVKRIGRGYSEWEDTSGVFGGCISLEEIAIPHSVDVVGHASFRGCSNLKRVTIGNPESVHIYPEAFFGVPDGGGDIVKNIYDRQYKAQEEKRKEEEEKRKEREEALKKEREEKEKIEAEKRRNLAIRIFRERMNRHVVRDMNNEVSGSAERVCPLCKKHTMNWLGRCTNNGCFSYRQRPVDAVKEMVRKVEDGKCPACGSLLAQMECREIEMAGKKRYDLYIRCSNKKPLACNLLFLHGYESHAYDDEL